MQLARKLLMMVIGVIFMLGAVEKADAMFLFHNDNNGPTKSLVTNSTANSNNYGGTNGSINANPVAVTPEPSTIVLLASGLLALGAWRVRQKR